MGLEARDRVVNLSALRPTWPARRRSYQHEASDEWGSLPRETGVSRRVLGFEQRALDLLAREEVPPLKAVDDLISEGSAEAVSLETKLLRIERQRAQALEKAATDPAEARRVVQLAEREEELRTHLDEVQSAIRDLMARRARLRLRAFLAEH